MEIERGIKVFLERKSDHANIVQSAGELATDYGQAALLRWLAEKGAVISSGVMRRACKFIRETVSDNQSCEPFRVLVEQMGWDPKNTRSIYPADALQHEELALYLMESGVETAVEFNRDTRRWMRSGGVNLDLAAMLSIPRVIDEMLKHEAKLGESTGITLCGLDILLPRG